MSMPDLKKDWRAPDNWIKIKAIDAHTAGEPLRVVTSGFPELPGKTILDKRRYAKENYDHLRKALMWEPRGHADMYGCIITPPVEDDSDFGVLFTHNEGFSTMCGHGIIGVTKVVLETGMMAMDEPQTTIKIDTPAGLVAAYAGIKNGKIESVFFHNVPSYVDSLANKIDLPDLGTIEYDLAFGGAYYAFVDADKLGLAMTEENVGNLISAGMDIKRAIMESRSIIHPFDEDMGFLYGTIFTGKALGKADSRNVCIFAEGEVDRSPTGTGVSARAALHYAKGELKLNEEMVIESIIGTRFSVKAVKLTKFASYEAVIPEVKGMAYITGKNELLIDPEDPLQSGFVLR